MKLSGFTEKRFGDGRRVEIVFVVLKERERESCEEEEKLEKVLSKVVFSAATVLFHYLLGISLV